MPRRKQVKLNPIVEMSDEPVSPLFWEELAKLILKQERERQLQKAKENALESKE